MKKRTQVITRNPKTGTFAKTGAKRGLRETVRIPVLTGAARLATVQG